LRVKFDGFWPLAVFFVGTLALPSCHPFDLMNSNRADASRLAPSMQLAPLSWQDQFPLRLDRNYQFQVPTSGSLSLLCVGEDQYFQEDGSLGVKGQILARELTSGEGSRSTPMVHLFFRNNFPGMDQLCPNFVEFDDNEKLNFWIWYFASLARTESDCGRNAYNPNDPHGVSVGELQMPASWKNRRWRGVRQLGDPSHAGGCNGAGEPISPSSYFYREPPAYLMADVDNNLSCGVEVLAGVLCGFYSTGLESCQPHVQPPFGHGFWRKLQGEPAPQLLANIQSFPLCH
jgi:hypothetical protein